MLKIRGTFSFRLKSTVPPTPINCCWKWKPSPLAWNANIWRIHYKILLFDEGEKKRLQTTGWFCSIHRTWTGYRSGVMTPSGGGINKKDFGFRLGFIYIFFAHVFVCILIISRCFITNGQKRPLGIIASQKNFKSTVVLLWAETKENLVDWYCYGSINNLGRKSGFVK